LKLKFSTKKIYAYLNGGLGNQMFQYAAARSLSLRLNCELVLDTWSGFVRDYQYRRQYELDKLPIQGRRAFPLERLPIWIYRWKHRGGQILSNLHENNWYGEFLVEQQNFLGEPCFHERYYNYQPYFEKFNPCGSAWLVGYWQSPRYFEEYAKSIRKELMPPTPSNKYRILGEEMEKSESVALGLRLYEESTNPSLHAMGGRLKGIPEIQEAISRILSERPNVRFFVFCTHRTPLISLLDLPDDTVFVTQDDGYTGALESLWLITRCRHHIFTNSSYYWWGAWLSSSVRGVEGQKIITADNFINIDGLCSTWERF
jgi:hypothetical protein